MDFLNFNYECFLCDLDGKFINFNPLNSIFFYNKEYSCNKRIFSIFHNKYVIGFIKRWKSNFKRSFFLKDYVLKLSNGCYVLANINIYYLFNKDLYVVRIIYLSDKNFNLFLKKNIFFDFFEKFLFVIRYNFLLGTFFPLILGILLSVHDVGFFNINYKLLFFLILGTLCLHLTANTFNDYYDWKSGADKIN